MFYKEAVHWILLRYLIDKSILRRRGKLNGPHPKLNRMFCIGIEMFRTAQIIQMESGIRSALWPNAMELHAPGCHWITLKNSWSLNADVSEITKEDCYCRLSEYLNMIWNSNGRARISFLKSSFCFLCIAPLVLRLTSSLEQHVGCNYLTKIYIVYCKLATKNFGTKFCCSGSAFPERDRQFATTATSNNKLSLEHNNLNILILYTSLYISIYIFLYIFPAMFIYNFFCQLNHIVI